MKKKFKTESKRLLDLMANSIYTNTDIFLRELISNASDALDKKHYLSLTDSSIDASDLSIEVRVDKDNRTITVSDNGIGMDKDDLENNLGTIANSGSLNFKEQLEKPEEVDIIGQFGVGFYSAFMVAKKIEVLSLKANTDKAYLWVAENEEGYEIQDTTKQTSGTSITLWIKDNTEEKNYDKYLDDGEIQMLIKKYSDYIRYPIKMEVEIIRNEDDKTEKRKEIKVINSMTPIWKKSKNEIKEEDYNDFYFSRYYDYNKPLKTIHYKVEGITSYTALLYIPSKAPYNYYTNDYKVGLSLYSKGVFIKDEASELISDCFRFVRGLVDSDDLNLNISREILQQDYQMQNLKKSIDKKVKSTLEKMLEDNREDYEKFFNEFGLQLKYGAYDKFGQNKDLLIDLLLFKSSHEDKYVSFKEYLSRMKDDQNDIYYVCGDSVEKIKDLPQLEKILDKGYEVLYLTDNVDEFLINILHDYNGKTFKSINNSDIDLDSEEEKEASEKKASENKDLLDELQSLLKDEVKEVKISTRLKSHPVCLSNDQGLSLDMEKVLKEMNQGENIRAERILELNPNHPLFEALKKAHDEGKNLEDYAKVLYDQALLIAGLDIEDPADYSLRMSKIMVDSLK